MNDLTTASPSPWLTMQDAVLSLRRTQFALGALAVFVWVAFGLLWLRGTLDFTLGVVGFLAMMVAVILVDVHRFCAASMERVRQLSMGS